MTLIAWEKIKTVLLDMDGTLLDLNYDTHFWRELVPHRYALSRGLDIPTAKTLLDTRFHKARGTLDWYCLDYWTRELNIDIGLLKKEVAHLIAFQPYALDFLRQLRQAGKRLVLVTNAHQKSLSLKMEQTCLADYLDAIICAHDLGAPKEHEIFWHKLQTLEPYDPTTSLLIDDNLEVLRSARRYGITYLLAITRPDSKRNSQATAEFPGLVSFQDILPT